ncbi:hypothetical protein SARC_11378 [Sphaeroforma arctica JP610]|uniref:Uncharacterized protein n=1 Tax=Sphaeroforma arctica JP610 TaxID=667725 RepID=A0A0L0FH68_9EUKA|nr:hypothetical protein SARC_11378 [Sphaeroforma arctica JP610]KNC76112.1 hypothetical protein SARC_11378 [Sphaeroforma arctica JP610]|eukprot:XP_014150014.1 hypothetical protein SARC_11378 [Sphaeroforma arctica JP610]
MRTSPPFALTLRMATVATEMQKTFRVGTLTGNFRLQQQLHICQMANIRPIIRQYEALLKCGTCACGGC